MTPNEKKAAAYAKKRENKAERRAEREAQIKALQQIRDNPDTFPSERLQAVVLLEKLRYY